MVDSSGSRRVGLEKYLGLPILNARMKGWKYRIAVLLVTALSGCEESATAPRKSASRMYYTFAGTITEIQEPKPGRSEKLGVRSGDSVYYVFAVDTLRLGLRADAEGSHPRSDSLDRTGRRPFWFFDSLMSVPLNGTWPDQPGPLGTFDYLGYRVEQSGGYGGTFLTNDFSTIDSTLRVAICFDGLVGGPTLPEMGTIVSGTESFYGNEFLEPYVISSVLKVIAVGSGPVFPSATGE
jgi:hypothetical protein